MQPIEEIKLGEIITYLRDLSILAVILTFGWKARGFWQAVTDTKARIFKHMDIMEAGLETLLSNHLPHIEEDLEALNASLSKDDGIRPGETYAVDTDRQATLDFNS